MDRGFHFGFEGCGGGLVVLSLRREGTYTVSPSEPRNESPSEPRLPVEKSNFHGIVASTSTPSTRRLLDGVAVPVPYRSTEPASRRNLCWLISTQPAARSIPEQAPERVPRAARRQERVPRLVEPSVGKKALMP